MPIDHREEVGGLWKELGELSAIVTHMDRDPYHYDVGAFEWACSGTGLVVTDIGDWGHPRNQQMLMLSGGT